MQVIAFSTPALPEWRWRIVNYAGEMIEESRDAFPSIESAVAEGAQRLREMGADLSVRPNPFRRTSHLRIR
jgi:hypothetical protein